MYGQYQTTPIQPRNGESAQVRITQNRELIVAAAAPVGGGVTWGAATNVTMSGASATLLEANAARKGFIVSSPSTNAVATIDITGGTASLTKGIPVSPGQTLMFTGAECPLGRITQIGTNTQLLTVYEGT